MRRLIEKEEVETIRHIVEEYLKEKGIDPHEEVWVDSKKAQEILGVRQTQLYLIRTEPQNKIVFSQPNRKNIMYLKQSLYDYLNRNIR